MIRTTYAPIRTEELLDAVRASDCGATVLFVGTTRDRTGQVRTKALDYESHRPMAESKLRALAEEARTRFDVAHIAVVHRLGYVLPQEASVAVAVSAPHRAPAFQAAAWLMDRLKEEVPIWKKDIHPDGTGRWAAGRSRVASSDSQRDVAS